jgi:two-component system CheB/CheR fusion protein
MTAQSEESQQQPPTGEPVSADPARGGNGEPTRATSTAGSEGMAEGGPQPTIVGIGASAGGLEAITALLEALNNPSHLALIFAQHLAPDKHSNLAGVLRSSTALTVVEAQDQQPIEPGHLYVIPAQSYIRVEGGRLRTKPRDDGGHYGPVAIDLLFRSLADSAGSASVGVLLSGTGTDGTSGLREIRSASGLTFAQDPDSVQHPGMPQTAIDSGVVDRVLPLTDLARELQRQGEDGSPWQRLQSPAPPQQADDGALHEIFQILHRVAGVDFSGYKRGTIERRLNRRMALAEAESLETYRDRLAEDAEEVRALYRDLLIHVTRFFREPETFEALTETALPKLLQEREQVRDQTGETGPLRVWVAGCSTGEEAYSLAMVLSEQLEQTDRVSALQIFASDISSEAIQQAREGQYAETIREDVSQGRLRRFFTKADDHYSINRELRDRCVFAVHDLTRDPPFSRMDLVVCRNLLIYLNSELQRRVLTMLHYALKPHGMLMLGPSESVGSYGELFSLLEKRGRIYTRRAVDVHPGYLAQAQTPQIASQLASHPQGRQRERPERSDTTQTRALALLVDRYAPPAVLADSHYNLIQLRGRTGAFLQPPTGEASLNLLKMAREGLLHALRSGLTEAGRTRREVIQDKVMVKTNDHHEPVTLRVIPISDKSADHYLVLFESPEGSGPAAGKAAPQAPAAGTEAEGQRVQELENELGETRSYLQSVIEDLEMTNEDLQSANEEVVSSNEELQSTNEELDTAKEEVQSTNEELNTLNDELRRRNQELTQSNSDLVNLLKNVQIPVVIVDRELGIRRFTPAAEQRLQIIEGDIDRPIGQLSLGIDCPDLEDLLHEVIEHATTVDRDVQDTSGRWHSMRLRPYLSVNKRIDGAVMTLFDVDHARRLQKQVEAERDYARAIVETVQQPLLVLNKDLRVQTANQAFSDAFRVPAEQTRDRLLYELGNRQWDIPQLHELLDRVQKHDTTVQHYTVEHDFPAIGRKQMRLNARRLEFDGEGEPLILLAIEDVTPQSTGSEEGNASQP